MSTAATTRFISLVFAALLLSACASWPRYVPAEPRLTATPVLAQQGSVLVLFESVFPDKPFVETVVDNAVGAIWSPDESARIGFTQNYAETLSARAPQLATLSMIPAQVRVGFAAAGSSGDFNISSRIMVPVGRFITENTAELLRSVTVTSTVCQDLACTQQARAAFRFERTITVRMPKMRVAEEKTNHITLEVQAEATIADESGRRRTHAISAAIKDRSVTSEGWFHADILRVMNKVASELSTDFAPQLVAAAKS